MQAHLPALQVVLPLFGAFLAALIRRPGPAFAVTLLVSWLLPVIAALLLVRVLDEGVVSYQFGGFDPSLGIEYRIDIVNAPILLLVSAIAAVVAPYARPSVAAEIAEDRVAWFYAVYLLAIAGLLGVLITGDAFNAFVFLEIASLASYTLIALGRSRRALVAAFQYLIMGTVGATFYVIGVGLLYVMTGTLNLVLIADRIAAVGSTRPIIAALAFIVVGIGLKLALFPLHAWLPNAYAYAPSAAAVFLSAAATKVAIYLLARFLYSIFGGSFVVDLPVGAILIGLSIAAIFIAPAAAILQTNVKRMFAYSSVGQIGYITLGLGLATATGLTGGLIHLIGHSLMKGALFMGLGAIFLRTGRSDLADLAGIGRRMPYTMIAFTIAGLGLVGLPGTVGFVSKWYLVLAALEAGWWWLAALIVASSLITLVYVGRVAEAAWFREPSASAMTASEAPREMLVPIWILAAATIFFGVDADPIASIAGQSAEALLRGFR